MDMLDLPELETKPKRRQTYPIEVLLRVEKDYVQGKGILSHCCNLHNVNYEYAKDLCYERGWVEKRRKWLAKATEAFIPPDPEPEPKTPVKANAGDSNPKLAMVEQQLEAIDRMLSECEDVKTMESLWRSKEKAMEVWARLTGFPRPGVRKQTRSRRDVQDIQPLSASPEPVPSEPSRPLGWEYD